MDYPYAASGDVRLPESAVRYNALSALIRNAPTGNRKISGTPLQYGFTVDVLNDTDKDIPAFTPVTLHYAMTKEHSPHFFMFATSDAAYNDLRGMPWGVTTATIPFYGTGTAVISGLALTNFSFYKDGEPAVEEKYKIFAGENVSFLDGYLIQSDSGNARVIAPPEYDRLTEKWLPGIIDISGNHEQKSSYGDFHVRCISVSPLKFAVEKSSAPADSVCGHTPFDNCRNIPRTEIAGHGFLCLVINYITSDTGYAAYSHEFKFFDSYSTYTSQVENGFAFCLAHCADTGKVILLPENKPLIQMPGWVL